MEREHFEKAQQLEERIFQLNLLKKYLTDFLQDQPFKVSLEVEVFGQGSTEYFPSVNRGHQKRNSDQWKEDADYVLDKIQERMDDLQTQFKKI